MGVNHLSGFTLADPRLAQKISQVPGVGLLSISGSQKPAPRGLDTRRAH